MDYLHDFEHGIIFGFIPLYFLWTVPILSIMKAKLSFY